jgi:hypothetical protein
MRDSAMTRLVKFLTMPRADQAALVEACGFLLAAQILITVVPFRWIARGLGTFMLETLRDDLDDERKGQVLSVRRSLIRAAGNVPWKPKCLAQSVAATLMLKLRRIPTTLYFGVRKGAVAEMGIEAHAWVRAGRINVTPRGAFHERSIVAVFGA